MVCMLEHSEHCMEHFMEHCMEHCMMEPSIFCLHAHTNLCSLSLSGGLGVFSLWWSGGLGNSALSLLKTSSILVYIISYVYGG